MEIRFLALSLFALCGVSWSDAPSGVVFSEDPELGAPFQVHGYDAGENGKYHATLIRYPWNHEERPKAAILYVHGFNDYFFQQELAQKMDASGYAFYAIDLHNYGRSYREGEVLGELRSLTSYFPELDSAVQKIRGLEQVPLAILGHSTGGLVASVYASRREAEKSFDAIVLNSPFLDMNMHPLVEFLVPAVSCLGLVFPDIKISRSENPSYGESIHKNFRGEWDYNLNVKSLKNLPIDLGWLAAIHAGHATVQQGLALTPPILVMHSNCSVPPGVKEWREEYTHCDGVLDVEDIDRYGRMLGKNVKMETIQDGLHDLYLSKKSAREQAYGVTIQFLDSVFGNADSTP